ncbi:hypothetical protein ACEN9X_24665 [Mucilaginibacter sp. Mucisp86]|uniref:hypothetical protein n=1 Tax=Mucilaginibacter sp. Mucisp86 TaxID=3243060 RepID=UPI0039B4A346
MKKIKRLMRLCGLIMFMILAVAGIGILGVAPTLTKDRKLFADKHPATEMAKKSEADQEKPDE